MEKRLFTLRDRLTLRLMRQLAESPEGRAHLLNQVADAEDNGESEIFERVLDQVDDDELRKLVVKHKADEIRHAALFRARRDATGIEMGPVPAQLRLIDRIDTAVGGFLSKPITDRRGIMEAYVMLQVVEERAITQFALFVDAFKDLDPESAAVFEEVGRDEERHLRYCQAISKRYAPSEKERLAMVKRYRELEATCFKANGSANLKHSLERGYLDRHPVWKVFWRTIDTTLGKAGSRPLTHFYFQAAV